MSDSERMEYMGRLHNAITGLGAASIELDELGMDDERDAVNSVLTTLLARALELEGYQARASGGKAS